MIAILSAIMVAGGLAPTPRGDAALSCQLQVYAAGQKKVDLKGEFLPFIIRFQERATDEASIDGGGISLYDPSNLLRSAAAKKLILKRDGVDLITSIDGTDGILYFSATDFEHVSSKGGAPRKLEGHWVAVLSMIGGPSERKFKAIGPCRYFREVSDLSDVDLIIQKVSN